MEIRFHGEVDVDVTELVKLGLGRDGYPGWVLSPQYSLEQMLNGSYYGNSECLSQFGPPVLDVETE